MQKEISGGVENKNPTGNTYTNWTKQRYLCCWYCCVIFHQPRTFTPQLHKLAHMK